MNVLFVVDEKPFDLMFAHPLIIGQDLFSQLLLMAKTIILSDFL